MNCKHIDVSFEPVGDLAALRAVWESLEVKSKQNVFLSWQWIGCWLASYQPDISLLKVSKEAQIIGLGLFVKGKEHRRGLIRSSCMYLHQTGNPLEDQIWIEYNGLLVNKEFESQAVEAAFRYLCSAVKDWDEIILSGIDSELADSYARVAELDHHKRWEAPCFGVNLANIKESEKPYLDTISRNTRYQIKRSRKLYQKQGDIFLSRPNSVREALKLFDEIGPLHIARWGAEEGQSGFANPQFVAFHKRLIETQWETRGVDIVCLNVGSEIIATLYNLVYGDTVYFYLGGIKNEHDNKLKPGLLLHSLCIEEYCEQGFLYYDFMGGDERYKTNLGEQRQHLVQVALQRYRLKLKLEHLGRKAKKIFSL